MNETVYIVCDRVRAAFCQLAVIGMIAIGLVCQTAPVRAADGPWLETDFASIRLISASAATGDLDQLPLALEFLLQPGWKVYWRSPGDAGLPPRLFRFGPDGPQTRLDFPLPSRFSLFGLDSYGYAGQVILPFSHKQDSPGQPASLSYWLEALICSDICVPVSGKLALSLPAGPARLSSHAQPIAHAAARVPGPGTGQALRLDDLVLGSQGRLIVSYQSASGQLDELFVETPLAGYSFAPPLITAYQQGSGRAIIQMKGAEPSALLDTSLRLTLVDGAQMAEFEARLRPADAAGLAGWPGWSFLLMLGIAFLGGVILNVMPCVLPVLSLKTAAVMGMAGAGPGMVRQRFLASAAGIITSFALLAAGLILLRAGGLTIGWGIQFQQPVFLAVMTLIVSLFAASLFDLVHFSVPQFAARLSRAKERPAASDRQPWGSDFMSGMLAALLATPCSAPFVGTAAGFALAAPAPQLALVMLAMGCGLAAPWLVFVALPGLALSLPRPGPWMVWVKRLLGLGLAGTALWLFWLFAGATGWLERDNGLPSGWQDFDRGGIAASLAAGRPVLVDVTADWCITCQANKKLVLETDEVRNALAAGNILLMRADWTLPDPQIADFLAEFGRFGIPFNIIFATGLEKPIILSEILTKAEILDALNQL